MDVDATRRAAAMVLRRFVTSQESVAVDPGGPHYDHSVKTTVFGVPLDDLFELVGPHLTATQQCARAMYERATVQTDRFLPPPKSWFMLDPEEQDKWCDKADLKDGDMVLVEGTIVRGSVGVDGQTYVRFFDGGISCVPYQSVRKVDDD